MIQACALEDMWDIYPIQLLSRDSKKKNLPEENEKLLKLNEITRWVSMESEFLYAHLVDSFKQKLKKRRLCH